LRVGMLPDGNALDLLARLKAIDPCVPVLILTAHGSIDLAVRAMKQGAENFITKPVELPTLLVVIERLLETQRARRKEIAGKSRQARSVVDPFLGTSPAIRSLAEQAHCVIDAESPILIEGETGTGKSVLAQWLHMNGPRSEEPFVDLNCAGLSREFLETELFGHEKGAFTGAVASKAGLLEVAHRGTVFLDEIGDMDPQIQPKLLKVLEEKRFRRLGEVRDRRVDIRLVAATNQDLAELVERKQFRADLYFRVNTIPLTVPPLRERREDIPILARLFLARFAVAMRRADLDFTADAERALIDHDWPGNIRELKNVLERAVLLGRGNVLGPGDLRFEGGAKRATCRAVPPTTLLDVERQHIMSVLQEEQHRVAAAAKRLGIPRSSLYEKLKTLGIETRGAGR
jgi:DNA-binding NtrC family response regulator